MLCPTCGRRPSERDREHWYVRGTACSAGECPDPIHDLADAAPETFERLGDLLLAVATATGDVKGDACKAVAALAAERDALLADLTDRTSALHFHADCAKKAEAERDRLRAALDEFLNRGGRITKNDGRDFIVVPDEDAVNAARAALAGEEGKP